MIVERLIENRVTPLMLTLEKTCSQEALEQHYRDVLLAMKAAVEMGMCNIAPMDAVAQLDKKVEESFNRSYKNLDK